MGSAPNRHNHQLPPLAGLAVVLVRQLLRLLADSVVRVAPVVALVRHHHRRHQVVDLVVAVSARSQPAGARPAAVALVVADLAERAPRVDLERVGAVDLVGEWRERWIWVFIWWSGSYMATFIFFYVRIRLRHHRVPVALVDLVAADLGRRHPARRSALVPAPHHHPRQPSTLAAVAAAQQPELQAVVLVVDLVRVARRRLAASVHRLRMVDLARRVDPVVDSAPLGLLVALEVGDRLDSVPLVAAHPAGALGSQEERLADLVVDPVEEDSARPVAEVVWAAAVLAVVRVAVSARPVAAVPVADLVAVAAPTVDSAPLLVAALVVRVTVWCGWWWIWCEWWREWWRIWQWRIKRRIRGDTELGWVWIDIWCFRRLWGHWWWW